MKIIASQKNLIALLIVMSCSVSWANDSTQIDPDVRTAEPASFAVVE